MGYVEFLRVRRSLVVYCFILVAILLVIVVSTRSASIHHGSDGVSVTVGSHPPARTHGAEPATQAIRHVVVPFGALVGFAAYASMIFALTLGSSLNKENDRGGFAFTKPISRGRLALLYFGIDVAGIVLAFLAALLGALVTVAALGLYGNVAFDADAGRIAFLGLGVGVMWYGLLQAATAGLSGGGGRVIALSVVGFVVLVSLTGVTLFGPLFHVLVLTLNLLNPLAYMTGVSMSGDSATVAVGSIFKLQSEFRAALTWCIAAASCAVAVAVWKRVEV